MITMGLTWPMSVLLLSEPCCMMVFILFFASLLLLLIVGFNVATILTTEAAILDQVNDDRSVSMKRGNLQSNV